MSHFTANQIKYIDWLAMGKYSREPATEQLFAETIGINRRTLIRWKKGQNGFTEAEFWDAVTERAREFNRQALTTVYDALRDQAEKGSFQHQKLLLELTGEYTETRKIEGGENPLLVIDGRPD